MGNFFDRKGQPMTMTLEAWALALDDFKGRQIASAEIGGYRVSTVWLGIDHGFGMTVRPLIFESMVFHGGESVDTQRYATEEDARAGHAELVAEVKGRLS